MTGATGPAGPVGLPTQSCVVDEFMMNPTATTFGQLGWLYTGWSQVLPWRNFGNHPGGVGLRILFDDLDFSSVHLSSTQDVMTAAGAHDIHFVMFLEAGDTSDINELRVGAMYPSISAPTRGEYFEARQVGGGGRRWFAVTKDAAGETAVDTNVYFVQDVSKALRIQRSMPGVVTFSIDGVVVRSDNSHAPQGALDVAMQARRWAGGDYLTFQLDYFSICFTNLPR